MSTPSRQVRCKINGCTSKARQRGRCKKHYRQWRRLNPEPQQYREPEHRKPYSVNDYRCLWDTRRKLKTLCEEWFDLAAFAAAVHPKPEGLYKLCRKNPKLPFGPTNFLWRKKVVMLLGETKKAYTARQRREAIARNPTFEREDQLRKKYGITLDAYENLKIAQNGCCAVCERPESSYDNRAKRIKVLSVDHCHDTGKIRGLLCFSCNTGIGKLGDSIERIEAALRYLKKHAKPDLRVIQGVG